MTREDLFHEIVETSKGADNIFLQLATGLGKTRISCGIADAMKAEKILVLVPELPLIANFQADMEKWGYTNYISKAKFNAYASTHLHEDEYYDIIIMDEAHHLSEARRESLSKIKTKKRVFLSAKIEDESLIEFINDFGSVYEKTITLKKAQSLGLLPSLKIHITDIKLDDNIKRNDAKYGKKVVKVTDKQYYEYLSNKITYLRGLYQDNPIPQNYHYKRTSDNTGLQRQKFLSQVKEEKAKEIISWLEKNNHRYVVFAGSIEQADRLGGLNAIHSKSKDKPELIVKAKTKSKVNDYLVNSYNNKEINSLVAVGMLQEGYNLTDTKYGIVIQLGNKERKGIQISGRIIRTEGGTLIVIRVKGTVDERYVQTSLQSVI